VTAPVQGEPIAVVLLPGGGGHLDLDPAGLSAAPRGELAGALDRLLPSLGFATALADPDSRAKWRRSDDGLHQDFAASIAIALTRSPNDCRSCAFAPLRAFTLRKVSFLILTASFAPQPSGPVRDRELTFPRHQCPSGDGIH
jgi:hypothetical protein